MNLRRPKALAVRMAEGQPVIPDIAAASLPVSKSKTLPQRILCVEDYAILRQIICKFLADSGYEIVEVRSGEEALELVGSGSAHFDVIITDNDMLGLGDVGLVTELRAAQYKGGLVVMSGKTDPAETQSFQQLEVLTISKPISFGELLKSVQALTRGAPEK